MKKYMNMFYLFAFLLLIAYPLMLIHFFFRLSKYRIGTLSGVQFASFATICSLIGVYLMFFLSYWVKKKFTKVDLIKEYKERELKTFSFIISIIILLIFALVIPLFTEDLTSISKVGIPEKDFALVKVNDPICPSDYRLTNQKCCNNKDCIIELETKTTKIDIHYPDKYNFVKEGVIKTIIWDETCHLRIIIADYEAVDATSFEEYINDYTTTIKEPSFQKEYNMSVIETETLDINGHVGIGYHTISYKNDVESWRNIYELDKDYILIADILSRLNQENNCIVHFEPLIKNMMIESIKN
jgi:hypothetical protein